MIRISVIIPTLNEENHISTILTFFQTTASSFTEVLVADGGSTDATRDKVNSFENVQLISCTKKGRAFQMNEAASKARGELLYFVHADVVPTESWEEDIWSAYKAHKLIGGFRFKFNSDRPLLRFNSYMTRLNILSFRGGDQTLYISKNFFDSLNGYQEWEIMEEYDLIKRARKEGVKFNLIQKHVIVSARKYENNSYFKINLANGLAMLKFRMGVDHRKIRESYFKMINHPKC
ncbi:MAG: TIGR04283 family arsenosugar biosynthesis glycosyltransferase [Flavobacteriales bacterium]